MIASATWYALSTWLAYGLPEGTRLTAAWAVNAGPAPLFPLDMGRSLLARGEKEVFELLGPQDAEWKASLPNCTVCRGCNAELEDITKPVSQPRSFHWSGRAG